MGSHFLLQEMFQNRHQTFISCIAGGFFSTESPEKSYLYPMLFYPCHTEAGSPSQELSFLLVGAF